MGITVMNLVTAIIVNSSLQSANEDREARLRWESALLKKTANRLDALFRRIDADGDGEVAKEELVSAILEAPSLRRQLSAMIDFEDLIDIFHLIDEDQSGAVDFTEFTQVFSLYRLF